MPKSSNHHLAQITWKEVTCQLHKQTLSCYSILLQDLQGKPTHHLQRHPDTSASALARLVSFRTSFLSAFSWKTSEWCHFTRNAPFGASRESRHASRIKKRNGNTNKLLMLLTDKRLFSWSFRTVSISLLWVNLSFSLKRGTNTSGGIGACPAMSVSSWSISFDREATLRVADHWSSAIHHPRSL